MFHHPSIGLFSLNAAVTYLADALGKRSAAPGLLDGMEGLVGVLRSFPEAHAPSRDRFLAARGYRKAVVGSHVVLCLVDGERGEVVLTNIVHGSSNYARAM